MANADTAHDVTPTRPKRADAQRNYDKLIAAAREAFSEDGASAALEDIARRAGVGIGTLYRNFPRRQDLLEAVYVGEFEAIAASAADFDGLEPWEALSGWLHEFVRYAATKKEIAGQLLAYIDADADLFKRSRAAVTSTGDRLVGRAQDAGVVRKDVSFYEIGRLVAGISVIHGSTPEEIGRILDVALDGLRYRGD
jgi:AcrR family transcriptional regulator